MKQLKNAVLLMEAALSSIDLEDVVAQKTRSALEAYDRRKPSIDKTKGTETLMEASKDYLERAHDVDLIFDSP